MTGEPLKAEPQLAYFDLIFTGSTNSYLILVSVNDFFKLSMQAFNIVSWLYMSLVLSLFRYASETLHVFKQKLERTIIRSYFTFLLSY